MLRSDDGGARPGATVRAHEGPRPLQEDSEVGVPIAMEPEPRSRRLGLFLRIALSAVMLALLLDRIPKISALKPQWDNQAELWLAGALVVTLGSIVLSAIRWQQVATALGLRTGLRSLVGHYLAGQFVSNFLPSTIGGDVLRVSRLSAMTGGEGPRSFASVVLERLTGWLVLPLITLAGLAINPGLFQFGASTRLALFLAFATLAALAGVLWAAAHPRLGGRWADREGWQRFIDAVHYGVDQLRHNPHAALGVIGVGFAYQISTVVATIMAAEALGVPVGPTAIIAFMPAVAIAQVIPISFGGLGLREGAFVLFLHPLGVPTAEAITLGLLLYAINLVVSLLGAPAFASGARPVRAAA